MKNKKNIIILTIVAIFLVLVILGVIYFTTDLFKTEQQLFYKYIAQTQILDSDFLTQYNVVNEKIMKNSNSSNMNIDFGMLTQNQETGANENKKLLNIKSNALKNSLTDQGYRDFTFSSNEQNFLTLKYLKDGNTHALFADNIVAKYLAVENSNLNTFFTKLGVQDTTKIPDSIPTNYDEILKIDEATLEQLKQTYGTVIYNNINEESFYKIKNSDKTVTIGVSLTEQELIDLLKVVLETAKNDNTLLNLIVTKAQQLNYTNITVEIIQTEIQNILDEMINQTYSTDKGFVKLSLIKSGKVIKKLNVETSTIQTNNTITTEEYSFDSSTEPVAEVVKQNIEIDFSESNKIILYIKENNVEIAKTTFEYLYDNNNVNMSVEAQFTENESISVIKAQYQINNYQTDNITQNFVVNMSFGTEENYQINMTNNITLKQDVQISKLTTENSAKLNDMTSEELSQLFIALVNRINQVYGESLIGLYTTNNITTNNMQITQ